MRRTLSKAERLELIARARAGDERAATTIIDCNLGLCFRFAKRYGAHCTHLQLEDFLQMGRLGIWDAIRDYDPTKGAWSTFASHKIRGRITRGIREDLEIQVPAFVLDRTRGSDEPRYPVVVGSLDARLAGEGSDTTRHIDLLAAPDDTEAEALASIESEELADRIQPLLGAIPEAEQRVIVLLYGLNGHRPHSLREAGAILDLSAERVRQRHTDAIRRLRFIARQQGHETAAAEPSVDRRKVPPGETLLIHIRAGMTVLEIAALYGISPTTTSKAVTKAKRDEKEMS